jgi:hypothetical protein
MINKIKEIKPKDVIELNKFKSVLKLINPPVQIGSPSIFEMVMILNLIKRVDNESLRIFEFGTFQGYTTSTIMINFPDAKVTSLDLPKANYPNISHDQLFDALLDGNENDRYLKNIQNSKNFPYFSLMPKTSFVNLELKYQDSFEFKPRKIDKYDFIFVDGGHNYKNIENDSLKSFKMMSSKSMIVWHDYQSKIHKDVTFFLENLSQEKNLYSINGTSLVLYSNFM